LAVAHKAISVLGTRQPCRLASPAGSRAATASSAEGRRPSSITHQSDHPSRHTPAVLPASAWRQTSSTSASNAEGRRPSPITHEAISRQATHLLRQPAPPSGERADMARAMLKGGGRLASRTRRSAVKAHTRCADRLDRAANEQHHCGQCWMAQANRHHARGDQPSRHTPAVPISSAGRQTSCAEGRRPPGVTHEAISHQATCLLR